MAMGGMGLKSKRPKERVTGRLPVVLYGGGCKGCPALRINTTQDERYCIESGEFLFDWEEERGESCPLEGIEVLEYGG